MILMFKNYVNRAVIEQNVLHFFIYTTSWWGGNQNFYLINKVLWLVTHLSYSSKIHSQGSYMNKTAACLRARDFDDVWHTPDGRRGTDRTPAAKTQGLWEKIT